MKKAMINRLAMFSFLAVFFFIMGAFVNGTLYCMDWPEGGRVFVAMGWMISLFVSCFVESLPDADQDH